jgi:uncharacterized protein (DUF58 family)
VGEAASKSHLLDAEFLRKLEHLALMSKRTQVGMARGERKSKRRGSSVEFADFRDYVQGDDPRHVDWNIVARLNTIYLKLFHEQEDLTLHLLIDASKSMAFGSPPKIEFANKVAAALGYIALAGYDRVCAEAFAGNENIRLTPCRGKAAHRKLFAFLESIQATGVTRLEDSCRKYALRNRARGVAVLISDFLDPAGFEGALRRLAMTGSDMYVVHILARDEIDPPISGDLRLIDAETDLYAEISMSRTLLKRYKDNMNGFCSSLKSTCLARGIGYIPATNDMPFERLTLDFFRRGGMLR